MSAPLLPKNFSPDDLEVTAELLAIVERLQQSGAAATATAAAAAAATGTADATSTGSGLRELPSATDGLRHKLQHARTQLRSLPDVGRTVAAQEAEIEALEARLQKQRAVLQRLRDEGARFAAAGGQKEDKMEL